MAVNSALFKFEGVLNAKTLPSFRLNINSKLNKTFSINMLTPFNSLVSSMFFDGKNFVYLDMKTKTAYVDKTPPFTLKQISGIDIELFGLISFFNNNYSIDPMLDFSKEYESGKILTNKTGEIVIIGNNDFRAVLTPIGKLKKSIRMELNFIIPEKFKVIYVD